MSYKCGKCNLELKQGELTAKCNDCSGEFHPACTQAGAHSFTKAKSKNWKCESCVVDSVSSISQRSSDSSAAAVDKKTLFEALNIFKADLKSHTDVAVSSVIKKIDLLNEEVRSLASNITLLEDKQNALAARFDTLEHANVQLTDESRMLRSRLDDLEQHSRCSNIEIVGIPMTPRENVYAVLQQLAMAVGMEYKREDISLAHRLRLFSKKHQHPPIICQLVSRSVKEDWLAAARSKKPLKTTDLSTKLQSGDVYINDHLTANNKALLGRSRRLQREGKLHFAGYFSGKILVKLREGDASIRVTCQEDLDKLVGK